MFYEEMDLSQCFRQVATSNQPKVYLETALQEFVQFVDVLSVHCYLLIIID